MGHRSTQTQDGKTEDGSDDGALGLVIRVDEAEVRSHPAWAFHSTVAGALGGSSTASGVAAHVALASAMRIAA